MNLPEHDWKTLRALHQVALERYCARVLDESRTILDDDARSAHERYLRLYGVLEKRNQALAAAFNDMRRSVAISRLAALVDLALVTDEELGEFSAPTRDSALALARISKPRSRRRPA
jgi:hypothetical protein